MLIFLLYLVQIFEEFKILLFLITKKYHLKNGSSNAAKYPKKVYLVSRFSWFLSRVCFLISEFTVTQFIWMNFTLPSVIWDPFLLVCN